MGVGCDKGERGGVWFTMEHPYEQAKDEKEDHVKYTHEHPADELRPAQLKAEKLSRPSLRTKDSQVEEDVYEFFIHQ